MNANYNSGDFILEDEYFIELNLDEQMSLQILSIFIRNYFNRRGIQLTHRDMHYDFLRYISFYRFPPTVIHIAEFIRAGFYYSGYQDFLICYCCGYQRGNWLVRDVPSEIHRQFSPNCLLNRRTCTEIFQFDSGLFRYLREYFRQNQTGPRVMPMSFMTDEFRYRESQPRDSNEGIIFPPPDLPRRPVAIIRVMLRSRISSPEEGSVLNQSAIDRRARIFNIDHLQVRGELVDTSCLQGYLSPRHCVLFCDSNLRNDEPYFRQEEGNPQTHNDEFDSLQTSTEPKTVYAATPNSESMEIMEVESQAQALEFAHLLPINEAEFTACTNEEMKSDTYNEVNSSDTEDKCSSDQKYQCIGGLRQHSDKTHVNQLSCRGASIAGNHVKCYPAQVIERKSFEDTNNKMNSETKDETDVNVPNSKCSAIQKTTFIDSDAAGNNNKIVKDRQVFSTPHKKSGHSQSGNSPIGPKEKEYPDTYQETIANEHIRHQSDKSEVIQETCQPVVSMTYNNYNGHPTQVIECEVFGNTNSKVKSERKDETDVFVTSTECSSNQKTAFIELSRRQKSEQPEEFENVEQTTFANDSDAAANNENTINDRQVYCTPTSYENSGQSQSCAVSVWVEDEHPDAYKEKKTQIHTTASNDIKRKEQHKTSVLNYIDNESDVNQQCCPVVAITSNYVNDQSSEIVTRESFEEETDDHLLSTNELEFAVCGTEEMNSDTDDKVTSLDTDNQCSSDQKNQCIGGTICEDIPEPNQRNTPSPVGLRSNIQKVNKQELHENSEHVAQAAESDFSVAVLSFQGDTGCFADKAVNNDKSVNERQVYRATIPYEKSGHSQSRAMSAGEDDEHPDAHQGKNTQYQTTASNDIQRKEQHKTSGTICEDIPEPNQRNTPSPVGPRSNIQNANKQEFHENTEPVAQAAESDFSVTVRSIQGDTGCSTDSDKAVNNDKTVNERQVYRATIPYEKSGHCQSCALSAGEEDEHPDAHQEKNTQNHTTASNDIKRKEQHKTSAAENDFSVAVRSIQGDTGCSADSDKAVNNDKPVNERQVYRATIPYEKSGHCQSCALSAGEEDEHPDAHQEKNTQNHTTASNDIKRKEQHKTSGTICEDIPEPNQRNTPSPVGPRSNIQNANKQEFHENTEPVAQAVESDFSVTVRSIQGNTGCSADSDAAVNNDKPVNERQVYRTPYEISGHSQSRALSAWEEEEHPHAHQEKNTQNHTTASNDIKRKNQHKTSGIICKDIPEPNQRNKPSPVGPRSNIQNVNRLDLHEKTESVTQAATSDFNVAMRSFQEDTGCFAEDGNTNVTTNDSNGRSGGSVNRYTKDVTNNVEIVGNSVNIICKDDDSQYLHIDKEQDDEVVERFVMEVRNNLKEIKDPQQREETMKRILALSYCGIT